MFSRYNMMRLDPSLCFLNRCGPPDQADIQEELKHSAIDPDRLDEDDDSMSSRTPSESRASSTKPDDIPSAPPKQPSDSSLLPFPNTTDLNGRLRRLITAYQREYKKEEARLAAIDKRNERRERIEQVIREREQQKIDLQQRQWTKKEETDFLRTVLAFGVEYSRKEKRYVWDRFRQLARLEKKYDDSITEYFTGFVAMCKKVLGQKLSAEEDLLQATVEQISEEKANLALERIELLNQVREEIVTHSKLDDRLQLCDTALDLPEWWIPGVHDKDLLYGVARHGLSRMEYYVLNDPELSFKDVLKRHLCNESLVDKKAMEAFEKRIGRPKEKAKKEVKVEEKKEEVEKMDVDEKPKEEEKSKDEAREEEVKEKEKPRGRRKEKKEEKPPEVVEEFKETRSRRKSTKDATDATRSAIEASKMAKAEAAAKHKEKEKKSEKDKDSKPDRRSKDKEAKEKVDSEAAEEKTEKEEKKKSDEETSKKTEREEKKAEAVKEETTEDVKEKNDKKEDEKASEVEVKPRRRKDVSIPPPQISIQQMEQMAKGGMMYDMEVMNELMAQTYAAAIKWPKDKILEVRLTHIVSCVEKGVWPVPHDYPLGDHLPVDDTPATSDAPDTRETATPMSESSEVSFDEHNVLTDSKKKRGRKPLDFSEEKSKIRALLQQPTLSQSKDSEDAR